MKHLSAILHRKSEGAPSAKLPTLHRTGLVFVYVALAVAVAAVLYSLGKQIRTRSYPAGSITLTTPHTRYLVGDEIIFTVRNHYNSMIFLINNCPTEPLEVYRFAEASWKRIHGTADKSICNQQMRKVSVPPGKAVTGSLKPWKKLFAEPGKYRIVAYVDYYNALPYQDIEIVAAPTIPPIPALLPPKSPAANSSSANTNTASDSDSSSTSHNSQGSTPVMRTKKTISLSVGKVIVEYDATTIYVLSITPAGGYTYEGGKSGQEVEITFKNGENETQLQLYIQNGQLVQKVEN